MPNSREKENKVTEQKARRWLYCSRKNRRNCLSLCSEVFKKRERTIKDIRFLAVLRFRAWLFGVLNSLERIYSMLASQGSWYKP